MSPSNIRRNILFAVCNKTPTKRNHVTNQKVRVTVEFAILINKVYFCTKKTKKHYNQLRLDLKYLISSYASYGFSRGGLT